MVLESLYLRSEEGTFVQQDDVFLVPLQKRLESESRRQAVSVGLGVPDDEVGLVVREE